MEPSFLPDRPPAPRVIGAVNWRGLWTLYVKEVRRFLNVFTQTLLAPVVVTLLFLAIFALALGGAGRAVAGVDYILFLAPGLIVMSLMQNAFANTSSSIVMGKIQGNIVDVLMPPLSASELNLAIAGGGVTRGLMVGLAAGLAIWAFVPLDLHDPLAVLYFALNAAVMLALLGIVAGIWAERFEHIAGVTNFVIMPLSFLSGTFYSIGRLPPEWQLAVQFNPFFYLIDGLRYGFIGRADGSLGIGVALVLAVNVALWFLTQRMFATGYRLKA
ncbi:MAG: ABC transporter permease [Proteobacteria bacterium]|nr:ABC transporter permease [Pseudomonadota bacterium]